MDWHADMTHTLTHPDHITHHNPRRTHARIRDLPIPKSLVMVMDPKQLESLAEMNYGLNSVRKVCVQGKLSLPVSARVCTCGGGKAFMVRKGEGGMLFCVTLCTERCARGLGLRPDSSGLLPCWQAIGAPVLREDPDEFVEEDSDEELTLVGMLLKGKKEQVCGNLVASTSIPVPMISNMTGICMLGVATLRESTPTPLLHSVLIARSQKAHICTCSLQFDGASVGHGSRRHLLRPASYRTNDRPAEYSSRKTQERRRYVHCIREYIFLSCQV